MNIEITKSKKGGVFLRFTETIFDDIGLGTTKIGFKEIQPGKDPEVVLTKARERNWLFGRPTMHPGIYEVLEKVKQEDQIERISSIDENINSKTEAQRILTFISNKHNRTAQDYLDIAKQYLEEEVYDKAIENARSGLAKADMGISPYLHFVQATSLYQLGNLKEAVDSLDKAIGILTVSDPEDTDLMSALEELRAQIIQELSEDPTDYDKPF